MSAHDIAERWHGMSFAEIRASQVKTIRPSSPWMPTRFAAEIIWDEIDRAERRILDTVFKRTGLKDAIVRMAGSDAVRLSTVLGELAFGKTAYAGETTIFPGLWTSALDDTFLGNTTGETNYGTYARMSLTNNTTIFAAGTGTTTRTQTWPSDAIKSFAAATSASTNPITYLGALNGNAGSSADKGLVWCTVTSTAIATGDTPQLAQNAVSQVRD